MKQVLSQIFREDNLGAEGLWRSQLLWILTDIERVTGGSETFYRYQKKLLFGKTIELNTIKQILISVRGIEAMNGFVTMPLMLMVIFRGMFLPQLGYLPEIWFWLSFSILAPIYLGILYGFFLPAVLAFNEFHFIPCVWKTSNDGLNIYMGLIYPEEPNGQENEEHEGHDASHSELYFVIDGKKIGLNPSLENELKKTKELKLIAMNQEYFWATFLNTVAFLPMLSLPWSIFNPALTSSWFIDGAPTPWLFVHLFGGMLLASTSGMWVIPITVEICRDYFGWTRKMESKVRNLEESVHADTPLVRD
jgi:hypothetical protein